MSADRWGLVVGMVVVFGLRLSLTLADPDLVHPIDPAELGHLNVLPALLEGRLLWLLGADANVHHGAFFWLGLGVGAVKAITGSDLLAVRGMAAALAALAWGVWVTLARHVGGRVAAVGLGLCLAVPSPWMAQWTATLWGSHAEASLWTGLFALTLVRQERPAVRGLVLGLGVAWDPILWPTALLAIGLSPQRRRVLVGLVPAFLAFRAPTLLADPAGVFGTSFSEHPQHTLGGLLALAVDPTLLTSTLRAHLPLPLTATAGRMGVPAGLDALLTVGAVAAAVVGWRQARHRSKGSRAGLRLLVLAPWVHLALMVFLSPTRPALAHRYLVAWWPALLLVPWSLAGRGRALAVVPVMASVCALPVLRPAWSAVQADVLWRYPAGRFQALGLDRVPVARAPLVVAFLEARDQPTEGFAAAFSPRWGYPVWGEPFAPQVRAAGLASRLELARATGPIEDVDRDFGFGLVVVCDADAACIQAGLDSVQLAGIDTGEVSRGVDEGRHAVAAQR